MAQLYLRRTLVLFVRFAALPALCPCDPLTGKADIASHLHGLLKGNICIHLHVFQSSNDVKISMQKACLQMKPTNGNGETTKGNGPKKTGENYEVIDAQ